MPPNQSNPSQYPTQDSPSSNANVPEFLHLDPIPDPTVKNRKGRRKKLIIFTLSFLVLVLMIGAALAYWSFQQNSPQAKLYAALSQQMQTSYVTRHFSVQRGGGSVTTQISSDMNDPLKVKSDILTKSDSDSSESSIRTLVFDNENYIFSVQSSSDSGQLKGLTKGQWYSDQFHATNRKDVDYRIDNVISPLVLNSVQGLIPTGNFNVVQREKFLEYIRTNDVYQVTGIKTSASGEKGLTGYDIRVDLDKINALNKEIVNQLGLPQLFSIRKPYPQYQEATIWVDESSGRITEVTYNSGESKDNIDTKIVIGYSYPEGLSIDIPADVKKAPL